MKKLQLMIILGAATCLLPTAGLAEKAYVMNPTKITFRKGPAVGEKIITMLRQNEPVEILESKDGWNYVRLLGSNRNNQEGWVVSGFLTNRVPWRIQAARLAEENTRLKEKLAKIEGEWDALSHQREELSGKLEKTGSTLEQVQAQYGALRQEASGFLKLKKAYETTKTKMEVAQTAMEKLSKENTVLKSSQRNTWFLTGAAVLLVGLIFGLIMGRQQKKRRSSYY